MKKLIPTISKMAMGGEPPKKSKNTQVKEGIEFGMNNILPLVNPLGGKGLSTVTSGASKVLPAITKYFTTKNPLKNVNFSKYLTQEEAVAARGKRMIEQESKWVGQNNSRLKNQFENAVKNHNPASDYPAQKLGVNTGTSTEISKLANLSDANKARIAAHEVGHYYRNRPTEATEWNSLFDFSNLEKNKIRSYLRGKSTSIEPVDNVSVQGFNLERPKGVPHGDEIRERAAQLKDYIAQKNNIPLSKNFTVKENQLDDAINNYVKDTGLDNNMTQMLSSLKDKKGFLNAMNKYALGLTGVGLIQKKN